MTCAETDDVFGEEPVSDPHSSPFHGANSRFFAINTGSNALSANTSPVAADLLCPWDSPSPRPLSAHNDSIYSALRASTTSPMMTTLASGLAELQPIGDANAVSVQASPPPVFSLALASPTPITPALIFRVSPCCNGASSRILHSSPRPSLQSPLSQSYSDHSRYSHLGDSSSSLLSTSASSSDDFASTTTDNSSVSFDFPHRYSDELPRPTLPHHASPSLHSSNTILTTFNHHHPQPQNGESISGAAISSPSFGSRTSPIPLDMNGLGSPNRANPDSTAVRSRSRTLHSIDRYYCSGASPSSASGEKPSVGHANGDHFSQIDVSSPTRSRGGKPNNVGQRTANFLSNPRPSITRQRRESLSRPKPKPFTDGAPRPKDVAIKGGLIPELSSALAPSSPSRPQGKLPYFHKKGDITCNRISSQTVRICVQVSV